MRTNFGISVVINKLLAISILVLRVEGLLDAGPLPRIMAMMISLAHSFDWEIFIGNRWSNLADGWAVWK